MRVILDTGVFFSPKALERLARLPHDVVIPAVVFTERARQLSKRGIEPSDFHARIEANDFHVEAFGMDEACRWAMSIHDDEEWRRLARDAMIAGHLDEEAGDVLWTTNPSDFEQIGVDEDRIAAIDPG